MNKKSKTYCGIRYAHAERFAEPVLEAPLTNLDDLEMQVKICPQNPSRLDGVIGRSGEYEEQSEDCLRLAVYTPSTDGRHPVLVWIHGGAYLTGSGLYPKYDALALAEVGDIVVVCVSYRLGALGFSYYSEKGIENLGIKDQVCALRWVQQNIHLFGGNPEDVTIFGQSAGAYSVLHHIANVREPLFTKAIVASAPFFATTPRKMLRNTHLLRQVLGKAPQDTSVSELLQAQAVVASRGIGGMPFSAISGSMFRPETVAPGLKKVMLWCQQDDALPFVPMRWMTSLATRLLFLLPMKRYARFLAEKGILTTWTMRTWRHGDSPYGAVHCMELPLLFADYDTWRDAPFMQGVSREEYTRMATQLKTEVIRFME